MRTKKSPLWALLLCLTIVTGSWASDLHEAIVGKWQKTDGTGVLEVGEGGKMFVVGKGFSLKGTYDFIDEKRVLCKFRFGSVVYTVVVSDNVLILEDTKGRISKYHKCKASSTVSPPSHPA